MCRAGARRNRPRPKKAARSTRDLLFARTGLGRRMIAQEVCRRLGYEIFGSQIIDEIAKDLKVQRKTGGLPGRIGPGLAGMILETFLHGRELESREYFTSLVRVINTLAIKGGGADRARLDVHSQAENGVERAGRRAARVARAPVEPLRKARREAAREKVLHYDREREGFIRRYFREDIHNPPTSTWRSTRPPSALRRGQARFSPPWRRALEPGAPGHRRGRALMTRTQRT